MATLEDLDDLERDRKDDKKDEENGKDGKDGDAEMKDANGEKEEPEEDALDAEILNSSTRDIINRRRLLENEMRIMKSEYQRLTHEKTAMNEKIKDNVDKIDNNRCVTLKHCLSTIHVQTVQPRHMILIFAGNYRTSSATLSRFLTWTFQLKLQRKVPISTSMPHVSVNPPSSRPPHDKPSSYPLSDWLTTKN